MTKEIIENHITKRTTETHLREVIFKFLKKYTLNTGKSRYRVNRPTPLFKRPKQRNSSNIYKPISQRGG